MSCGTCARLLTSGTSTVAHKDLAQFKSTNTGYQLYVGTDGPRSNEIPYVVIEMNYVIGFSASINVNNLQVGTYTFEVCKNVISNAAVAQNVLATITLTLTQVISGTLILTNIRSDVGAQPTYVSVSGTPYVLAPATVQWTTNVAGVQLSRNETVSLYFSATGSVPTSAQYEIFLGTQPNF